MPKQRVAEKPVARYDELGYPADCCRVSRLSGSGDDGRLVGDGGAERVTKLCGALEARRNSWKVEH